MLFFGATFCSCDHRWMSSPSKSPRRPSTARTNDSPRSQRRSPSTSNRSPRTQSPHFQLQRQYHPHYSAKSRTLPTHYIRYKTHSPVKHTTPPTFSSICAQIYNAIKQRPRHFLSGVVILLAVVGFSILAAFLVNQRKIQEVYDSVDKDAVTNGLEEHNSFRALYDAPPLRWNTTVAKSAALYSAKCIFEHSGNPYGENLCLGAQTMNDCISMWEDEDKLYDWSKPGFSHEAGHFTQMVWESTTDLGCGITPCDGRPIAVCQYYPAGNIVNEGFFEDNVHRRVS